MSDSNGSVDDKSKELQDTVKNVDTSKIGDVGKFIGLAIGNAIQIIFIGYLGACMSSMGDMTDPYEGDPETFHFLFPTDLDNLPYKCPGKDVEACKYKGGDVLSTDSGGKQWFKIIFEVIWPMNAVTFPYKNYYSNPNYQDQILYGVAQWMAWTCAGAFSKYRAIYKAWVLILAAMSRSMGGVGDIIVFYFLPYVTLYLFVVPGFPQGVGSLLAFWCSIFTDKVQNPHRMAFAPIYGALILISTLIASINFCMCQCCSWVVGLLFFFGSMVLFQVNMMWIMAIGIAIGLWSAMVTLFSPIMWKNGGGWADMKRQFKAHRRGLLIYFIISTACAAGAMLSPVVSSGVMVGGLIALYLVLIKHQ